MRIREGFTKMEKTEKLKLISIAIKQSRINKGLRPVDVANALDMERANYSRIESGKANINFFLLLEICEVIGVNVIELLKEF